MTAPMTPDEVARQAANDTIRQVTDAPIPCTRPFPRITLGRGRWLRIIKVLRATDAKVDAALADMIERDIS